MTNKGTELKKATETRNNAIDLLRLLACFFVVLLHVAASKWHNADVNGLPWKVFNFYNSASRAAVPLFFMISGSLFLSKPQLPKISVIFRKYVLKVVVLYVVWGILYAIDTLGIEYLQTSRYTDIFESFVSKPKFHLWYLPALASVYFLMPICWCVVKYRDGEYLRYACAMFLLTGVVWNTVQLFVPHNSAVTLINKFSYELCGYVGYFLLGYYLSKKSCAISGKKIVLIWGVIVVIATLIGQHDAMLKGKPSNILYGHLAMPACLEAMLLFVLFNKMQICFSEKVSAALAMLSRSTLFVYLFHPFLIEHLEIWFGLTTTSFTPLVSVPVISALIFLICQLSGCILLRVPLVNRWIV